MTGFSISKWLSGSAGISKVNGPLLAAEDIVRNDKKWVLLTIFSISIGANKSNLDEAISSLPIDNFF